VPQGLQGRSPKVCGNRPSSGRRARHLSFHRSVEPPTEEAAALVLALLASFVVEGPEFTAGDDGR
jgi:hypothetical protein